jgi:hypothetical protein
MLVSGLLTPLAVFVRLSLRSTLPADWQQHFLLSGCGLPLLPAPRWFSLAVACDARFRAFIRSTTFSPFGRAFAVMGLCQTLAAVSKATPPGNRTLFHSLGDHPLGIATRSTPTRQAIADGSLVIFPPTAITTPTASVPGTNGVNGRIC